MKRKISLFIIFVLAISLVGCKDNTPEVELPEDTKLFLEAVENINFSFDCKDQLEEAFTLYDNLGENSWDFDEVLDAFDVLVQMETLLEDYKDAEQFISLVDNIPYNITLNDKAKIEAALLSYDLLSEQAKEYLGVDTQYARLTEANDIYKLLESSANQTNDQLMVIEFLELTKKIPSLNIFIYDDISYVEDAEDYYATLSENAKTLSEVVNAYKVVTEARKHYNDMLNDPSIYDEIIIVRFIELVSNLPTVENVTLDSSEAIIAAEDNYSKLTETAKTETRVVEAYTTLSSIRSKYNKLVAEKEALEKEELLNQQILEFTQLVEALPIVDELTKDDGINLAEARFAYDALPKEAKEKQDVILYYEKIVALEEKFDTFELEKITFSFYNLITSGGTAPNVVLQGAELTFYSGLKSLYNVSSNEELARAVDLYLYIYYANENNPNNYVCYGNIENVLANISNVVSYATVVSILQEASKTDPEVVSGAYKFGVKVVDRLNMYADSDIFMGTGVIEYTFNSLYDDGSSDTYDYIEIDTKEEFLAIKDNLSGHYVLTADIDLEGMEWENLGEFKGTLDGRGHKITNIAHSMGGDAIFGIFLEVAAGAKVSRIVLEGTITDAGSWAGAICVRNYGIIENCIINLDITALGEAGHIGGISTDNNGIINNCLVLSKIDGQGTLYGECTANLVINNNGTISYSYACKDNSSSDKAIHANNGQNISSDIYSLVELKESSLYSNWNSSIWNIVDGEIPTLIVE